MWNQRSLAAKLPTWERASQPATSLRGEHEECPGWKQGGLSPLQQGCATVPNLTRVKDRLRLRRQWGENDESGSNST